MSTSRKVLYTSLSAEKEEEGGGLFVGTVEVSVEEDHAMAAKAKEEPITMMLIILNDVVGAPALSLMMSLAETCLYR